MSKIGVERVFRAPRWVQAASACSALLFLVVAILSYRTDGLSLVTLALLSLVPIAVLGLIDAITQRIELHPDHIVIVRNLSRRKYPRDMFVKAQWGKGVPTALLTNADSWIDLPGVGTSGLGLANSLRAWIKH